MLSIPIRSTSMVTTAEIVAGAGSMGIEILEQVPNVDVIVCPVGGAGLIAGLALAVKTLRPTVEVHGVGHQLRLIQSRLRSWLSCRCIQGWYFGRWFSRTCGGDISFEVARRHVNDTRNVTEMNIAIAILRLLEHEKAICEAVELQVWLLSYLRSCIANSRVRT